MASTPTQPPPFEYASMRCSNCTQRIEQSEEEHQQQLAGCDTERIQHLVGHMGGGATDFSPSAGTLSVSTFDSSFSGDGNGQWPSTLSICRPTLRTYGEIVTYCGVQLICPPIRRLSCTARRQPLPSLHKKDQALVCNCAFAAPASLSLMPSPRMVV